MTDQPQSITASVLVAAFAAELHFVKTVLIMNSGALVTILVSATRTTNDDIVAILIGASTHFGWGLTAALIGSLFYLPHAIDVPDLQERYAKHKIQIGISAMLMLSSAILFLWGLWKVIDGLKDLSFT